MTRFRLRKTGDWHGPGPAAVLQALPAGCCPVLLDSSDGSGHTMLAWHPDRISTGSLEPVGESTSGSPGARYPLGGSAELDELFAAWRTEQWSQDDDVPTPAGGWIGYLGFECGHAWEPFPWTPAEAGDLPDFWFGRFRQSLVWDARGRIQSFAATGGASPGLIDETDLEVLLAAAAEFEHQPAVPGIALAPLESGAQYRARVAQLREWIGSGELYQANLSHPLAAQTDVAPRRLYASLRRAQPTRMSAYWEDLDGRALLSSSPERFLSVAGEHLETQPIKGTAARSDDRVADATAAAQLADSEKEVAELTMIVDMARHDLGRIARTGSVKVVSPGSVEAFSTVWHRTATIRAEWDPQVHGLETLLAATFPPASVTGAPKVRALQAISELEQRRRGPYCGSFGYVIPGEPRADFSVLIRTAVTSENRLSLRVGAGIVWDSDPESEWRETLLKARYFARAVAHASEPLETLA